MSSKILKKSKKNLRNLSAERLLAGSAEERRGRREEERRSNNHTSNRMVRSHGVPRRKKRDEYGRLHAEHAGEEENAGKKRGENSKKMVNSEKVITFLESCVILSIYS